MSSKLFVGNFVFSTTEQDLRDLFAEFGTVEEVVLINDRETGRSRGFGFVSMSSGDEAQAAIDGLDGKSIEGRNLAVSEARPQERRESNFGGGGGGFKGGGGGRGGGRGGGFRDRDKRLGGGKRDRGRHQDY